MSEFGKRLIELRKKKGLSRSALARLIEVTPQAIIAWEKGINIPRGKKLTKIADKLDTNVIYLITGKLDGEILQSIQSINDDEPYFPIDLEIEVKAPVLEQIEYEERKGRFYVDEAPFRKILRLSEKKLRAKGILPENIVCIVIQGDSMQPLLPNDSEVAINTADTTITDGSVYAIIIGNELLRVRSVYTIANGKVVLRSFNRQDYIDEQYSFDEIKIIGKIFWSSFFW